jgi:formate dehydrogenase major subunit
MVQLTINGKQIEAQEGMTVLAAAKQAGIDIPTLCAHKELTPFGGCRLCIVEVQGFRVPIASCTLPVSNGMVINTETDSLKKSRKFILSMLFSERNHFCPFCQVSGGDCELQNAAYREEMTSWPMQPGWNNFVVDTTHPYFVLDNNRCILCRRCVRACGELVGNFTLAVAERGAASTIVADYDVPLGESSCIKCGTCVQVCPTGALIDRTSAYQGHDVVMTEIKSVCVGCSVGCAVKLIVHDNRIVRIEGDWDGAVNRGLLCEHGRYDPMNETRNRITRPMIRKNGKLVPAGWDEALSAAAGKLGKGSVAAIASTRLSAEALALFKEMFADATCVEEGIPTAAAMRVAEKSGPFEGKLELLRTADAVLTIGADLARSHMVAGFLVKRALPKGTRLINVSTKESKLDELSDVSLKPKPGSDLALIEGLQAVIVKEGLGRTELKLADPDKALQAAVKATGLSAEEIAAAARILAHAVTPVIVYGKGLTAGRDPKPVEALLALAKLIGAVDAERSGLLSVKGEANSVAAAQLGLDGEFKPDGAKAAYVALGDDHPSKRLIESLAKTPALVVQAAYESALTEQAEVVLPAALWSEQSGHYVSMDGRVQQAEQAVTAPEGVRANLEILQAVAQAAKITVKNDWKSALHARKSSVSLSAN